MGIDLGLARVLKLLLRFGNPHIKGGYKSIHIAGTNGKGSVTAYLSLILTAANVRNGRFTSPHLMYYNDCIAINNETYPKSKFEKVISAVRTENEALELGCTEFEVLTVTAFKIFADENVQLAVVEAGLGGRLDATNVLEPYKPGTNGERGGGVIATGITKIAMDHESFLGSTLAAVANEKAGIIKPKVPLIMDISNSLEAARVIENKCERVGAEFGAVGENIYMDPTLRKIVTGPCKMTQAYLKFSPLKGKYQLYNLAVALGIIQMIGTQFPMSRNTICRGIAATKWPGRLQTLKTPNKRIPILLDGAHNANAAEELGAYLKDTLRKDNPTGLRIVMSVTQGKDVLELIKHIVDRKKDQVYITQFTPPPEMPWVKPYDKEELANLAKRYALNVTIIEEPISDIFNVLEAQQDNNPIVICGSLYLCGDILRTLETRAEK